MATVTFNGFKFSKEITPIIWKYYLLKYNYPDKPYQIYLSVLTDSYCLYDISADRMFPISTTKDLFDDKIGEELFLACDKFKKLVDK